MRKRKVLYFTLASLLLLGGYLLGSVLPISYLRPVVINRELTLNDLYTRVISIFGTVVTFLAVLAALLKEDIRKLWDYVSFEVVFRDEGNFVELLDNETSMSSTSDKNYKKASKYECVLTIRNNGSISAKNCEIYLEQLQFRNNGYPAAQEIKSPRTALQWNNNSESILIPPKGKAHVSVVELISPSQQSVTNENPSANTRPNIKIGNIESPPDFTNGIWEARFIIYSENSNAKEVTVELNWNGNWENRLTDLTKHLTIQIK